MRILNYKWVIFNFLPFESDVLEKYLEEMALKGWKLKSICSRLLIFVKTDKRRIKYTVDINKETEIRNGEPSEKTLEYREICKEVGWDFVCHYERIQIFSTEEEDVIPIHTDEQEKKDIIGKSSLKYILVDIILMIAIFININNIIGYDTEAKFLARNSVLLMIGCFVLYGVMIGINIVRALIWRKNDRLVRISYKRVRFRNYIFNIILLIMVIGTIGTLVHGTELIKVILVAGVLLLVVGGVYAISHEKMKSAEKIGILNNFVGIVGIILFILIINIYPSNRDSKYFIEEKLSLKLSDFNDKVENDDFNYSTEDESFLAKSIDVNLTGEKISLYYNVFESKNDMAMKIRLNRLKKYAKRFEKDMNEKLYEEEVKVDFIKDMKIYSRNNNTRYMLIGKNKVIEIDIWNRDEMPFEDSEEMLKLVYNKL